MTEVYAKCFVKSHKHNDVFDDVRVSKDETCLSRITAYGLVNYLTYGVQLLTLISLGTACAATVE
jgi:hypothetical protein